MSFNVILQLQLLSIMPWQFLRLYSFLLCTWMSSSPGRRRRRRSPLVLVQREWTLSLRCLITFLIMSRVFSSFSIIFRSSTTVSSSLSSRFAEYFCFFLRYLRRLPNFFIGIFQLEEEALTFFLSDWNTRFNWAQSICLFFSDNEK